MLLSGNDFLEGFSLIPVISKPARVTTSVATFIDQTASVAEWVRTWDTFLMVKESGRSWVRPPAVAL